MKPSVVAATMGRPRERGMAAAASVGVAVLAKGAGKGAQLLSVPKVGLIMSVISMPLAAPAWLKRAREWCSVMIFPISSFI